MIHSGLTPSLLIKQNLNQSLVHNPHCYVTISGAILISIRTAVVTLFLFSNNQVEIVWVAVVLGSSGSR